MSRSRKKTPISGMTNARSEKEDKQLASRKLRRSVKQVLPSVEDFDNFVCPENEDLTSNWSFDKDGKHYMHKEDFVERWGDDEYFKKCMRK